MLEKLVFYRPPADSLLVRMSDVMRFGGEDCGDMFSACLSELASFGARTGLSGNLWHAYVTYLLVYEENPYSIACEMNGTAGGAMDAIARGDFEVLKSVFDLDLDEACRRFDVDPAPWTAFEKGAVHGSLFGRTTRTRILDLVRGLEAAEDGASFAACVTGFYKKYGVGRFGLHKAFRLDEEGQIVPISAILPVTLDDLVGCDLQKQQLCDNTDAFVRGFPANNCLLFGDAGTGKSTSIKAIANQYYEQGLRIIEIYKHEFKYLNQVIAAVKNRNYRFVIYMDDLSFEEFEIEYKYLKAVIEGGLEKKPENVLIYATSNRRHLIHENQNDNREIFDLHQNDTKQEKLSLYMRFGVTIYFGSPDPKEFNRIVSELAVREHLTMDEEELLAEARKWQLHHGGLSGRTARQFVDHVKALELMQRA